MFEIQREVVVVMTEDHCNKNKRYIPYSLLESLRMSPQHLKEGSKLNINDKVYFLDGSYLVEKTKFFEKSELDAILLKVDGKMLYCQLSSVNNILSDSKLYRVMSNKQSEQKSYLISNDELSKMFLDGDVSILVDLPQKKYDFVGKSHNMNRGLEYLDGDVRMNYFYNTKSGTVRVFINDKKQVMFDDFSYLVYSKTEFSKLMKEEVNENVELYVKRMTKSIYDFDVKFGIIKPVERLPQQPLYDDSGFDKK